MTIGDWILIFAVITSLFIGLLSIRTSIKIQREQFKHSERIYKNEIKYRNLSLIINWAIDIDSINIPLSITPENSKDAVILGFSILNHNNQMSHNNNQLLGMGRQMKVIASDSSPKLIKTVNSLNEELSEYEKYLDLIRDFLKTINTYDSVTPMWKEYLKIRELAQKYFWEHIDKSAHDVIKEASKIINST